MNFYILIGAKKLFFLQLKCLIIFVYVHTFLGRITGLKVYSFRLDMGSNWYFWEVIIDFPKSFYGNVEKHLKSALN